MKQINFNSSSRPESGIALLMTMMVLGVVLAVTLSIVELSLQHLALSVDSRDSEVAFHAANAGLECARYMRRHASTTFEAGAAVTFTCFGASQSATDQGTGGLTVTKSIDDEVYRYTTDIDWGAAKSRCSSVDMVVIVASTTQVSISGPGGTNLSTVFPSYPTASKKCPAGAMCTLASVSGYNVSCANKNSTGVLKRQVLLEF